MTGRRRLIAAAVLALAGCGGGGEGAAPTPGELAADVGCLACHTESDTAMAPSLHGIWGTDRELADGSMVTVDDDYVRRSIVDPGADIAAGYGQNMPRMPLDDAEIDELVEWVRSLG